MIILNTPFKESDLMALKPFDRVLINGTLYMARDAAHKRMYEQGIPFNIKDQGIYYCGPCPERPGEVIGSAGPTSSYRMDKYSPLLLDKGLKVMIGKGRRNMDVISSIIKNKCVYFGAIGGLGAKLARCIKKQEIVAYEDLGTEALRKIEVENFPVVVIINCKGESIYDR
jgi:fumarate hydratase subunit beta